MTTTRIKQGDVTVTLSGDTAAWVRRALDAAGGAALRAIHEEAEKVARAAEAKWYTLVERETGKSGQIAITETINEAAGTVTVSVGSTDTRTAGKRNAPVPMLVRTPGPDSLILVKVSHAEYWATSERLRFRYPQVLRVNPNRTAKRQQLIQLLIRGPMEEAITRRASDMARRVAVAAEGA